MFLHQSSFKRDGETLFKNNIKARDLETYYGASVKKVADLQVVLTNTCALTLLRLHVFAEHVGLGALSLPAAVRLTLDPSYLPTNRQISRASGQGHSKRSSLQRS